MRVIKAWIQNYRSIVDSGEVRIEDGVTVLVGKNEQGKTTFLQGLNSFNRSYKYFPRDFPNHLRPRLESQPPATIPIVTLWLAPEAQEQTLLNKLVRGGQVGDSFKATRYFDGHYSYHWSNGEPIEFLPPDTSAVVAVLKREATTLKGKLVEHAKRTEGFAAALDQLSKHVESFAAATFADQGEVVNTVNTFSTALAALPGQDPPIQEEIASAIKRIETKATELATILGTSRLTDFFRLIPSFVIHSSLVDQIPDDVAIADFVSSPEGTSKGMASLCKVAGLSMQKIQELSSSTDTAHRETYEDHYNSSIEGGINEFWTQAEYKVHFRFDTTKLSVSISDDVYSSRIPPSQRSDGFRWYLSFYSTLLSESSNSAPLMLLLDNPGLELHADGQRDIKRFLEEKLPRSTQVAYVTHSSAMVDPFRLDQLRIVTRTAETEGTKVGTWSRQSLEVDLLEPIRSAIGASLLDSLMFNQYNVLVEGAADKAILEGAFHAVDQDFSRRVLINGPVSETPQGFLPRFYLRSKLPFVVFVDADSGGRRLSTDLQSVGVPELNILSLGIMFPLITNRDFELEDILTASFYHEAVKETYPGREIVLPELSDKKRTKEYEAIFHSAHHGGFSKKRVGETVRRMLLANRVDSETLANLKTIVDRQKQILTISTQ